MLVHQASPIENRVWWLPTKLILSTYQKFKIITFVKFKLVFFCSTFCEKNINMLLLNSIIAVKELNKEGWKDIHHAAYEGNLAKYTLMQSIHSFLTKNAILFIRAQEQLLASRFSASNVMHLLSKRLASQMQSYALI